MPGDNLGAPGLAHPFCQMMGKPILDEDGCVHPLWITPILCEHWCAALSTWKVKLHPFFLHPSLLEMGAQLYFNWKKGLHPFWANMGAGCVSPVSNCFLSGELVNPHRMYLCAVSALCMEPVAPKMDWQCFIICTWEVIWLVLKNNHKQTNAMSFCPPLSPFAENP